MCRQLHLLSAAMLHVVVFCVEYSAVSAPVMYFSLIRRVFVTDIRRASTICCFRLRTILETFCDTGISSVRIGLGSVVVVLFSIGTHTADIANIDLVSQ